jgi:hypothetical protein
MHLDRDDDGNEAGDGGRRGAPLRPSKRAHRETLEAAASGIVSGLDLARLNSSRSGGSLRKVAAEAAAIGACVFADLKGTLMSPVEMLPWRGNSASSSAIVAAPAMGGGAAGVTGLPSVGGATSPMDFAS